MTPTSVAQHLRPACAITLLAFSAGCVKQLPARPTPEAIAPSVEGGRLIVDVVDGPTPVQRVQMAAQPTADGHVQFFETPQLLCTSPCAADVDGNVLLGFPVIGNNDLEVELVHVGPDPSVYRRSLSEYDDRSGGLQVLGIIGASVGSAALITGIVLLSVGLGKDKDGLATAGGITLGAGAVFTLGGIWAIRHDADTYRPGSANHFDR